MSILQTVDLKKYYGTKPNITLALGGVNISVEQGEFDNEDIEKIKNFATVKDAVTNGKESKSQETVIDICFDDMEVVLKGTPQIAELVGTAPEQLVQCRSSENTGGLMRCFAGYITPIFWKIRFLATTGS